MISVVVCTYNPTPAIFKQVLGALQSQTLTIAAWELIVIDNNSTTAVEHTINISWHPQAKVIVESTQGLAHARIRGVKEAQFECIVFVDDDNILDIHYLEHCLAIFQNYNTVGVFGGKALPVFDDYNPPNYITDFIGLIGCRDLGSSAFISPIDSPTKEYPGFAPIGTGMAIRKHVFVQYLSEIENNLFRQNLGRKGNALTSGEDNDIVITALKNKWQVAYFPNLVVHHIIPSKRTTTSYLAKMNEAQSKNWAQLLLFHNLSLWHTIPAWSVPLRKLKAWFTYKAWQSDENYIRWNGACGMFEGLAR